MSSADHIIRRTWRCSEPDECNRLVDVLTAPRDEVLTETTPIFDSSGVAVFEQQHGPFTVYRRRVETADDGVTEQTEYSFSLPFVGWILGPLVAWHLGRRFQSPRTGRSTRPWWAPPDQFDQRQMRVLGLLLGASAASAFMNTLFTQTSTFAADSFGVGDAALGWAGGIVRLGIIITIPIGVIADRVGRRRVITALAWTAPAVCALGAIAPTFWTLVATQTIGRPLAIAFNMLLAIVAAEEMPRGSRAYAVAAMTLMYGWGAGFVVMGLPLADLGSNGWRIIFGLTLVSLGVARSLQRRLPESVRFAAPHVASPPIDRRRLVMVAAVVVLANLFVAPASYFFNRYLSDVRHLSASAIALYSLSVGTPAALGVMIGGTVADRRGRRGLIALALPVSTFLIVMSFTVGGAGMWFSSVFGGLIGSIAAPALLVYRAELFPTGNRGKTSGLLNVGALVSGSVAIIVVGEAVQAGWSFGAALALCGLSQLAIVAIVWFGFPESAGRELESLNTIDDVADGAAPTSIG